MIDNLPLEIVDNLITFIPIQQLNNLAKVNHKYRYFCNKKIYSSIIYLDDYVSDSHSVVNKYNISQFISSLNSYNIHLVDKFTIFHDDANIYTCLLKFTLGFKLEVLSPTFYNYYHYLQNILLKKQVNHIGNLLVLDLQDLMVGYNGHENDEVETGLVPMGVKYDNLILNLRQESSVMMMGFDFGNVTCLNLSTTSSTNFLLNNNFTTPLKLQSLSLTYHHSFAREKLRSINKHVDLDYLQKLELKVSCIANCNCLVEFIQDLPEVKLDSFSLINYKFNHDLKNLYQFKSILPMLTKIRADLIYIHINDFGNNSWDAKLLHRLNCNSLVIPDFFVNYNFPWNFNGCQCQGCCQSRVQFNQLASVGNVNDNVKIDRKCIDNKIVRNSISMKYFNSLVKQAVKQYELFNRAIFATGSVNDWCQYPVKVDNELLQWECLMKHNFGIDDKRLVLGGIDINRKNRGRGPSFMIAA